jgi:hypothetical protein
MLFHSMHIHQRKIAALFIYIFSMQISIPCLAARDIGVYSSIPVNLFPVYKNDLTYPNNLRTVPHADRSGRKRIAKNSSPNKKGPGPGQPEQKSFESVNSKNMVDLFSGDFSYNIPLMDVGGYPVSIHYRSGITMDQEASWVGLGWNLQPGSINRNMRGIPDDFDGDIITKTESIKTNWTAGINVGAGGELFGLPLNLNLSAGLFYNSYRGIGFETGAGINVSLTSSKGAQGGLNSGIGINLNNNSQNGFSVEPSFSLKRSIEEGTAGGQTNGFSVGAAISTRSGMKDLSFNMSGAKSYVDNRRDQNMNPGLSGCLDFAFQAYTPKMNLPFTSYQFNFSLRPGLALFGLHPYLSLGGYYSSQYIASPDTVINAPAYGYMYLQDAQSNSKALMDFNREKELPSYSSNPPTPHLAIPNYTYDIYSGTGEGTGGEFRAYRGDIGCVRDPDMRSKSLSAGAAVDLGAGEIFHVGVDARFSYSTTSTGGWTSSNSLISQTGFVKKDSSFENVFFRNPAEKTTNAQSFYDRVGDTKVLLPVMTPYDDPTLTPQMQPYSSYVKSGASLTFDQTLTKSVRDKRSQVISFLTAWDASIFGLDKTIANYAFNQFTPNNCTPTTGITYENRTGGTSFRKPSHFSEITVLNGDGKRYIYGLPVYNLDQEEVSFSVSKSQSNVSANGNEVKYGSGANTTKNKNGRDNFYSREKIPPYASSFLLTGLVSADYVDRTGDGITDDDQGEAVKFGYTRLYDVTNPYKWRTPYALDSATYQEGLRTDTSDDKGSYIYGTKEIWYLNSIMTKTMIATFTLNDTSKGEKRLDGFGVLDENGGIDPGHSLRYLKQIDLYSKADYLNYIKNGTAPHPIKTVHFVYSYRLCLGAPGSQSGGGKLTLDSIWFSYNGNLKSHQNPYVFQYSPTNPSYNSGASDRWGTYKDPATNPNTLSNADFPYTLQDGINGWDSAHAAANASAWNLDSIKLPSTGAIKVDYESDDYAYVQNIRATEMMQVTGFSTSPTSTIAQNMYSGLLNDYGYVFIRVPQPATSTADVMNKYLSGISKIYFTYRVQMPTDLYGSGNEHVAVYAQFDNYGVTAADNHVIWIHMISAETSGPYVSPLAKAAIQSLRLNLPSKAFPGSDLNGQYSALAVCKALVGYFVNFGELITNFANRCRIAGIAKVVDVNSSFARLDNPVLKKFGGGLRVKRITITDNFKTMTGQNTSSYGQVYDYSTYQTINGISTRISSGVAAWEPAIGNEENPFRMPIEYTVQVSPLAPTSNMYSEYPLGEGYFPSAQVGYSKVRVHTINSTTISANGYEESEFYTSYDFPTLTEQTPLDERKYKPSFLSSLFKINANSYLSQTQGFKVEINDMTGKEKGNASYSENDPFNPIAYTKYYYLDDDDSAVTKHLNNTVAVVDSDTGHINPSAQIGKDIEVMVDLREENTQTKGVDIEFNDDGFVLGIIPITIPTVWPFPQWENERYRSAATMKLVQRYGILSKVLHYERGSLITTENLLFDGETGDVVLTRTKNEFDDSVYQFNYPAHWAYSGMDQAYKNISASFNDLQFTNGKITSSKYANIESYFESGDEVMLKGAFYKISNSQTVNACTGESSCSSPNWGTSAYRKLWAINASKIQNNKGLSGIYFIDSSGNFFTSGAFSSAHDTVVVLRSGKRNTASTSIGSVQSLASPQRLVGSSWKIVIDSLTKVVNTSSSQFSDFWKVEDTKISVVTNTTTKTKANSTVYLYPINNLSMNWYGPVGDPYGGIGSGDLNTKFVESESWFRQQTVAQGGGYLDGADCTWLEYDLKDNIPSAATVTYASLSLIPHDTTHTILPNTDVNDMHNHPGNTPHNVPGTGQSNTTTVAMETSSGILGVNWSTLSGTGNTSAQRSAFLGSTIFNTYGTSTIHSTNKENSYTIIDILPHIQAGLTVPRFALRFSPTDNWHFDGVHNQGRMCFWAADSGAVGQKGGPLHDYAPVLRVDYTYVPAGSQTEVDCDTTYILSTSSSTNCISAINDTTVNPYVFGMLGNWRLQRSYVYYDNRKEIDPTQTTDIRRNGTIPSFLPFWSFTSAKLAQTTDTTKWVWNSESTQFNKRGLELENHNALNIYNSAEYGYNESLPVAVTQNAMYRESAYEGFEDYGFPNSQTACNNCSVVKHMLIDNTNTYISTAEAHTGKYSYYVAPGYYETAHGNISSSTATVSTLSIRIDSSKVKTFTFLNNGTGLADTIYQYGAANYTNDTCGLDRYNYNYGGASAYMPGVNNLNYSNANAPGTSGNLINVPLNAHYYKVVWQGVFLADQDFNGILFNATASNSLKIWTGGFLNANIFSNDPALVINLAPQGPIHSKRGTIVSLRAEHSVGGGVGSAFLEWNQPNPAAWALIPTKYLYPSVAAAQASIQTTSTQCADWKGITAQNMANTEFSPSASSQIVISGWVKEEQTCNCVTYKHGNLSVNFLDTNGVSLGNGGMSPTYPSGNIIDGWQRIEGYAVVPAAAAKIQVTMANDNTDNSNTPVYFDDLRILPFNANMKSFVYDDLTLRLMAELDENNYATFYEYDDDGSLVRVKKETEQGIKTIKETRNALVRDTQ